MGFMFCVMNLLIELFIAFESVNWKDMALVNSMAYFMKELHF